MNNLITRSIARNFTAVGKRTLVTSKTRTGSFKVQDDKDFVDKVENSKEPVIVDFFATYVLDDLV